MNKIRTKLKNVELFKEEGAFAMPNEYYLKLTYEYEDTYGVWERVYPKIYLPITDAQPEILDYHDEFSIYGTEFNLDFGVFELPAFMVPDEKGAVRFFRDTLIEPKPVKMTLEEIEDALGHKVEIVERKDAYNGK